MPEFLVDRLANRVEGPAGFGRVEPESPADSFIGGALSQAVERGGEDVIGRYGRDGVVESGGEKPEEESEGGFGHAESVGPPEWVVGVGGSDGEEAAEPALLLRRWWLRRWWWWWWRKGLEGFAEGEECGGEEGLQG